jgi:hypothetical protein
MRHSNHGLRGPWLTIVVVGLSVVGLAGCGSAAVASAPPSAQPTPVVTPDPHLKEPVSADDVFRDIGRGGLGISALNANLGEGDPDVVKVINADVGGWPLRITQFKSASVLARTLGWTPGDAPRGDEAPYAFAGLNILVTFGPISAAPPQAPDANRSKSAATLVGILDPLLWPLAQRSVVAIPSRTPEPVATPQPSAKPSAKPTAKPSPKPSAKPTKSPSRAP